MMPQLQIGESMRVCELIRDIEETIKCRRSLVEHFHPNGTPTPYVCGEDLIRRHGELFRRAKDPPPLIPIPKACFQQCYRVAMRKRSKWIYCEGFGLSNLTGDGGSKIGFVAHHCWLTREDTPGEAFDLSWGEDRHNDAVYMGIKFKTDFVREMHESSPERTYFSVLDTWWNGHALLTGKINIENVIWHASREANPKPDNAKVHNAKEVDHAIRLGATRGRRAH